MTNLILDRLCRGQTALDVGDEFSYTLILDSIADWCQENNIAAPDVNTVVFLLHHAYITTDNRGDYEALSKTRLAFDLYFLANEVKDRLIQRSGH